MHSILDGMPEGAEAAPGSTPLHLAAAMGSRGVVDALLGAHVARSGTRVEAGGGRGRGAAAPAQQDPRMLVNCLGQAPYHLAKNGRFTYLLEVRSVPCCPACSACRPVPPGSAPRRRRCPLLPARPAQCAQRQQTMVALYLGPSRAEPAPRAAAAAVSCLQVLNPMTPLSDLFADGRAELLEGYGVPPLSTIAAQALQQHLLLNLERIQLQQHAATAGAASAPAPPRQRSIATQTAWEGLDAAGGQMEPLPQPPQPSQHVEHVEPEDASCDALLLAPLTPAASIASSSGSALVNLLATAGGSSSTLADLATASSLASCSSSSSSNGGSSLCHEEHGACSICLEDGSMVRGPWLLAAPCTAPSMARSPMLAASST
jgi:hypothetical protein